MAPIPEEAPVIRAVSFRFFHHVFLTSSQVAIHNFLKEWGFHNRAGASLSANADGSADDEQAGMPKLKRERSHILKRSPVEVIKIVAGHRERLNAGRGKRSNDSK
jgi:hypothetical protein